MKKQEVLEKIEAAKEAIREYREDNVTISKDVQEQADEIVKESRMLGPSGKTCPRCNGTGTV